MPPTDQPSDVQAPEALIASAPAMHLPTVGSTHYGSTAPPRHRSVSIRDPRFPSGRARVLAWDVVCQGRSDLSTMLCRGALGDFFLLCRPGDHPDVAPAIVPLSAARAGAWFDSHPAHFATRDALW